MIDKEIIDSVNKIIDSVNKGIDDFNDQCMALGVNSKTYHITNINSEEINMSNMIECKTDREVMLCEQVLRMCRGEASQFNYNGQWVDSRLNKVVIGNKYRAKPKKELVVPWEWIADDIFQLDIDSCGVVKAVSHTYDTSTLPIKLDLEGIDLPVTVKRP